MVRLTNGRTGVVVNVSEEKAAKLGSEWSAQSKSSAKSSKPASKRSSKSDSE